MLRGLRRLLILVHRYLGIPLSFLFVVWFASGIAMMYVGGMPALSAEERLAHLPELDLAAVRIAPAEAARRALDDSPAEVTLLTVLGRPAYRVDGVTVFADDGETLAPLDHATAREVAAKFVAAPEDAVRFERIVERPDQWTLLLGRSLPLEKFVVNDVRGTEVYVSPETAEVALTTTARTRAFAWLATIPHWFYFTALRVNQPLWYRTVVWAAELGCVLAALGLVLGVVQFRKSTPFSFANSIRYTGWMRWHYVLGVFFGVFALTWVFSGLLSMEPFDWTNARGLEVRPDALSGGPLEIERFAPFDAAAWTDLRAGRALKEIELRRIQDEPYYLARFGANAVSSDAKRERLHQPYNVAGRAEPTTELVDARTLQPRREPFPTDAILARLRAGAPDARIASHELLADYDSYYYSRNREAPLPVLRVKFDDPLETWVYVDPRSSRVLATVHRLNRIERWLYNGLHSLDFSFWYSRRPLWDIGMIALLGGALVSSAIGLCLGVKRLVRDVARLARGGASRPLLIALCALVLVACTTQQTSDPIQVSVAGVEPLEGEGLELRFAVKVRVQNPNDAPVEYNGVALQLDLNGRKFGTGVSDETGTVPRYGETVVTIPITVGAFSIARQVLGLVNGGEPKAVTYKVRGKLEGGLFGTRRFEDEGTVELPNPAAGPR